MRVGCATTSGGAVSKRARPTRRGWSRTVAEFLALE
jgi:hypothetical protein